MTKAKFPDGDIRNHPHYGRVVFLVAVTTLAVTLLLASIGWQSFSAAYNAPEPAAALNP